MSLFDPLSQALKSYKDPTWFKKKMSRRTALKTAAGATMVGAVPNFVLASDAAKHPVYAQLSQEPWKTLEATLMHLLPSSPSGPSAKDIHALEYLYNVIKHQPIDEEEKVFIQKGVGWLNGYSQGQTKQDFVALDNTQKEQMLKAISQSRAGHNWINTLINYLYEAMLSPPIYGGNPNGIGWLWLEHQAGFPLPNKGTRYYELPGAHQVSLVNINSEERTKS